MGLSSKMGHSLGPGAKSHIEIEFGFRVRYYVGIESQGGVVNWVSSEGLVKVRS